MEVTTIKEPVIKTTEEGKAVIIVPQFASVKEIRETGIAPFKKAPTVAN